MFDVQPLYYIFASLSTILALGAIILQTKKGAHIVWLLSFATWTTQLCVYFSYASPYSLSGVTPMCCIAALVVCLWQCCVIKGDATSGANRPRYNALFLLFLGLCSFFLEEVRHDSFMMSYIFAILFFLSRPLSLGLALFALGGMVENMIGKENLRVARGSKDAAFLAAIVFLGGEIVGCYWGFVGWGTTWRWTGNFYFSAMLFVLFMVPLHVPRRVYRTPKPYNIAFSLPLIVIVLAIILPKVIMI